MLNTATYSPDDNKLRIYPACRFDKDDYLILKNAGFKWAPRQKLFVAPMWTPYREDIALKYCDEIGDEDTSLVDRAEERNERFIEYSEHRSQDAENAQKTVADIAGNIPFGQPILVGHHSEARARRDQKKIQNGMDKAVKMWKTAEYWQDRAEGAIRHAKYKELPGVRARRIKKIEAEKRKREKENKESKLFLDLWTAEGLTREKALKLSGASHLSHKFPLEKYPRELPASQYEGSMSIWSAIEGGIIDYEKAKMLSVPTYERSIKFNNRWIEHLDNRLVYEKAMLEDQGAGHLLEKKPRPKQLPLLNYRAPDGIMILNRWGDEPSKYNQEEMTKGEYSKFRDEQKGCEKSADLTHRVRILFRYSMGSSTRVCVYLTDSKDHGKPTQGEPKKREMKTITGNYSPRATATSAIADKINKIKNTKIEVVSAPQFFPTPPFIASRMVEELDIKPNDKLLEPSAGAGALIEAVKKGCYQPKEITAVEINSKLAERIKPLGVSAVINDDFLLCNGSIGVFDKIIMNPPFKNGEDIKHIKHAFSHLSDVNGGRLVTLCANGPRQKKELMELIDQNSGEWVDLPKGSFKSQGTMVNTAMVIIEKSPSKKHTRKVEPLQTSLF